MTLFQPLLPATEATPLASEIKIFYNEPDLFIKNGDESFFDLLYRIYMFLIKMTNEMLLIFSLSF